MVRTLAEHHALVGRRVTQWCDALPAGPLYEPMKYLLGLPAKRVRPSLVTMGCELFGGKAEDALDEALGIELFHNFTLMHDDIMDAAPLRRGQPSVHAKWDVNTAILSGDAMLVMAYALMARRPAVLQIFGRCALDVCEGQQADMALEQNAHAIVADYMQMIRLKTAALLSCSLRIGALLADAPENDVAHIGAFGEHLGLAFQLRDDLLDAFGEMDRTGKQRGGDLSAGKRTWLLIQALERSHELGRAELSQELVRDPATRDVERMLRVIDKLGVRYEAEVEVLRHEQLAARQLDLIGEADERKTALRELAASLRERAS